MVADFCEFALDTRFMPGMNDAEIIRQIKNIVKTETTNFKFLIDDLQQPYEIESDHSFVKTYLETARRMGIKATLKGSNGATVITFFKKYGIAAFATGFGSRGTAHTTDEYAEVEKLYKGARLLQRFIEAYDRE